MSNRRLTIEGLELRQLMAYGDWDQSFGTEGVAEFSKNVSVESSALAGSAVLAPSGKLYLFGDGLTGNGHRPSIVRFNSDNTLDMTFGDQGKSFFFLGTTFERVIGQGNKFLAIINMDSKADQLVRLNEDGTLDRSFGKDGFLPVFPESINNGGGSRPNGSVLDIIPVASNRFLAKVQRDDFEQLVRFSPDGQLDTSFALNGVLGVGGIATATDSQGRIYATKFVPGPSSFIRVDRFTSEGVLSPLLTPIQVPYKSGDAFSLSITSDIVVASTPKTGTLPIWSGEISVRQFSLDGAVSNGFGVNGVASVNVGGGGALASFRLHRTPNGPIRIVGGMETGGGDTVWSIRLLSNGQPDPSYGPNGLQQTSSDSFLIADSVDLPGGQIAVVGEYDDGVAIGVSYRLMDASGNLGAIMFAMLDGEYPNTKSFERTPIGIGQMIKRVDDTYQIQSLDGTRGGTEYVRATGNVIESVSIASNAVVVLSTEGTPAKYELTKYNAANFSQVPGFGTNGRVAIDLIAVSGMKVHADKIYVWGFSANGGRIVRYLSDGRLDTTFGVSGFLNAHVLSDLVFDSLDRMFFVRSNSFPELVAFKTNGTLDAWQPVPLPELDSIFAVETHLSIDKEGNFFAAGSPSLDLFSSSNSVVVQRILANQTIDPNFGTGGKLVIPDHYIPASMKPSNAIVTTDNGVAILAQRGIDNVSVIAIALNTATNRFELDRTFSSDGVATVSLESQVSPQSISRLNDGSFLVSMFTESGRGSQGAVLRFQGPAINPAPLHNVFFPLDVTSTPGQPRSIDPLDVLAIVNHINSNSHAANTFPDVDGDGTVSPLDALVLVNFLNANSPLGGEAEGEGRDTEDGKLSICLADQYFASHWELDAQKRFRNGVKRVSP